MPRFDKDIKIGIVGAGPAGLSSAEALKALGYQNITILEKCDRVGGMSLSFSYPVQNGQEVIYELGSFQPTASKNLSKLIKENKLHLGKKNLGMNAKNHTVKINRYYF